MNKKHIKSIEDFVVYQKAVKLFEEFIEQDLPILQRNFVDRILAGNQLRVWIPFVQIWKKVMKEKRAKRL
uniref:Uncharacterized protein n=1 Tax=candidate division WOR-3 bacterium TaxID=2052148 RepID=A0A7V0Z6A5_UNCW3